jgi:hypothetical protein
MKTAFNNALLISGAEFSSKKINENLQIKNQFLPLQRL